MILDAITADKKLRRMALQIAESNEGINEIVIIGIKENGIFIAQKIENYLRPVYAGKLQTISLTINKKMPDDVILSANINLNNKMILLVDDVANSGKTMLYALRPLLLHYPSQIQTLVLVERTHKHFPLALNYVGLSVSTIVTENIIVMVENNEIKGAYVAP